MDLTNDFNLATNTQMVFENSARYYNFVEMFVYVLFASKEIIDRIGFVLLNFFQYVFITTSSVLLNFAPHFDVKHSPLKTHKEQLEEVS